MAQTHTVGKTATSIYTEDGITCVRYHATEVVKFNHELIELQSGGWETQTTRNRMNQASNQFDLGFRVYQEHFDWFVHYKDQEWGFVDNMVLNR